MKRTTIIDFVEKYTHEFSELTFLREKVNGVWTETSFRETREEAAGLMAQAIATMIQGYATATAQAATMGPWAWAAFGLTGLGQLMAMIAAIKSAGAFAQGGIVGGTSYTGDKQYIRVNSGEMILNGKQQARLFSMINSGGWQGGEVTFRIAGQQLVGVLNNYNGKMSKVR